MERIVRRSFLFRGIVRRFIAGETLDEAISVCESLCGRGFFVTLDYLGENTKSEQEAFAARDTFIQMLGRIATESCAKATNISIKLSQCGLDLGDEMAERNLRDVLEAAEGQDNFVRVDMEASEYVERTLQIMERVWNDHKNTGTVLQAYLYRTPGDIETLIKLQMRTRLVKGAYLEPENVAFPSKAKVDEAYVAGAKRLLKRATTRPSPLMTRRSSRRSKRSPLRKASRNRYFEFQMLVWYPS